MKTSSFITTFGALRKERKKMNQVNLVGRLTKEATLKTTTTGKQVATFTLAIRNRESADFINCQAWSKTAEIIDKYTQKGSLIGVTGRISTRSYDDKDGRKVYVTEVIVNEVELLESRKEEIEKPVVREVIDIPEEDLPF